MRILALASFATGFLSWKFPRSLLDGSDSYAECFWLKFGSGRFVFSLMWVRVTHPANPRQCVLRRTGIKLQQKGTPTRREQAEVTKNFLLFPSFASVHIRRELGRTSLRLETSAWQGPALQNPEKRDRRDALSYVISG